MTDTTADAVERLAKRMGNIAEITGSPDSQFAVTAAALRALVAERDAADLTCETALKAVTRANAERDAAEVRAAADRNAMQSLAKGLTSCAAERDAARAEAARMRAALESIARRIDLTTLDRDGCADVAWHRGEEARAALGEPAA